MPIQYKAGTPAIRNFDPKGRKGAADARGVYQTSAFYAPLCFLDVDTYTVDDTLANDAVQLLLFTSDLPAICRAYVTDENTFQVNTNATANTTTVSTLFVAETLGGGGTVTVDNYGAVLKGFSGALQAVPVSGFPALVTVKAPLSATVSNGVVTAGVASSVAVECIANAGSVSGVIGPVFPGKASSPGGSLTAPAPILLKSGDYTAAIRAAKNLVTDAAGREYQIVGLYYIVP